MTNIVLKKSPWKRTRWSPSTNALCELITFISEISEEKNKKEALENLNYTNNFGNFLEIGAGFSTWYLNQLPFLNYVAVETYQPVIDNINKYSFNNFTLVNKWTSIPKLKYDYIFVDSNVGGDASKYERERPFMYALDNNLLSHDFIMFVHDYHKIEKWKDNPNGTYVSWARMEKQYNLKFIKKITNEFGVYSL